MDFKITLIDGTFDLISFISDISYDNDMINVTIVHVHKIIKIFQLLSEIP